MEAASEIHHTLRFACTQCGACCNRSPEVALSEASALSDLFVFRLMFRLYELPRTMASRPKIDAAANRSSEEFYESKRLLAAFAARKYPVRQRVGGKVIEYVRYLTLSALTLDAGVGACSALRNGRCSIYERRPLACRTVPFHYSRPEASAEIDLRAFVATPGYGCDTTIEAPIVVEAGLIVDAGARKHRSDARHLAERDRSWGKAILRHMRTGCRNGSLPSLSEIEANAAFGATTTSMRVAWQIAAEAGIITAESCRALITVQLAVIDRELAATRCSSGTRETLEEMRAEYQQLPSN